MMTNLADLVRYSAWASDRLLHFALTVPADDVTPAMSNSHGGILRTFQHIYYADRVWLTRLEKSEAIPFEDPAPGPALAELDRVWLPLLERFAQVSGAIPADRVIHFRRTNGDAHSLPFGDLIVHVANHGTYHRGQIASLLRQSGHVPPSTDFLYYKLAL